MIAEPKAKELFEFDTIEDVLSDVAHGKLVIVTDDADRENEGDLVMAAEKVTPAAVNFMAKQLNTIPYEILTGISQRVKRVFFRE